MKSPERILVRAPNWIGDQILAYPFFHFLRQAYPRAQIISVCVQWVQDLQFRNLIDRVVVLPRTVNESLWERWKVQESGAEQLRGQGRYDLAIALPNSLSSAWLLYRAGARARRGYSLEGRRLLLNEPVVWDETSSRHRAQAYVDLLPARARPSREVRWFFGIPTENELDPRIPGVVPGFPAREAWPGFTPMTPPEEPYWVLAPGATAESRRWPTSYFAALARRVRSETGWTGLVVGGPKEAPMAHELCGDPSLGLRDWTARGPVPTLSEVFARAKFTLTNESGLAHVAAVCGSFVQIVCGAADPKRTTPLGPGRVQVAINPVECWPCERNTCAQPAVTKIQCLTGIRPETVWEEIQRGIRLG
jgi:heptosyltransferase-2